MRRYEMTVRVMVLLVGVSGCGGLDLRRHDRNVITEERLSSIEDKLTDKLTQLDARLDTLDQRVAAQEQDWHSFLQHAAPLSAYVLQQASTTAKAETTTTIPTTTKSQLDTDFRLTRVSKNETDEHFHLRVEYHAAAKPIVLLKYSDAIPRELLDIGDQALGLVEVTLPKPETVATPYDTASILLVFVYNGLHFKARLDFDNTTDAMDVPVLNVHCAQGTDVMYEPGSDAQLDLTSITGGSPGAIWHEMTHYEVTVQSDAYSPDLISYYSTMPDYPTGGYGHSHAWLDVNEMRLGNNETPNGTYFIRSNPQDAEGLLSIRRFMSFNCSQNCLLASLETDLRIRFYHQDHVSPFPEGFVGFVHHGSSNVVTCVIYPHGEYFDRCAVDCRAEGSVASRARITRVLPSGEIVATSAVSYSSGLMSAARLDLCHVTALDAGQYRCSVTAEKVEVSRDIALVVYMPATIDPARSSVARLENGSLLATCVAEGIPAPSPHFSFNFTNLFGATNLWDNVETVTQLGDQTSQTILLVKDAGVASNMDTLECIASSTVVRDGGSMSNIDHHFMPANPESET